MDGIKIEIPGVEVVGTLNVNALFQTLAAIHSRKHGLEITATVTLPSQAGQATEKASA
jgi:hypothetical protein